MGQPNPFCTGQIRVIWELRPSLINGDLMKSNRREEGLEKRQKGQERIFVSWIMTIQKANLLNKLITNVRKTMDWMVKYPFWKIPVIVTINSFYILRDQSYQVILSIFKSFWFCLDSSSLVRLSLVECFCLYYRLEIFFKRYKPIVCKRSNLLTFGFVKPFYL